MKLDVVEGAEVPAEEVVQEDGRGVADGVEQREGGGLLEGAFGAEERGALVGAAAVGHDEVGVLGFGYGVVVGEVDGGDVDGVVQGLIVGRDVDFVGGGEVDSGFVDELVGALGEQALRDIGAEDGEERFVIRDELEGRVGSEGDIVDGGGVEEGGGEGG